MHDSDTVRSRFRAHLYWYAVESFGHEDVNHILCQVVFNAEDHINVVWRNVPLYTQRLWYLVSESAKLKPVILKWLLMIALLQINSGDIQRQNNKLAQCPNTSVPNCCLVITNPNCFWQQLSLCHLLTSDLIVDPPVGSFSHAVELNEGLSDLARLQQEDELLFQLPNVHTRWSWGGMIQKPTSKRFTKNFGFFFNNNLSLEHRAMKCVLWCFSITQIAQLEEL